MGIGHCTPTARSAPMTTSTTHFPRTCIRSSGVSTGWVDDRINDWFAAHSSGGPEDVTPGKIGQVPWFEFDGKWVKVKDPWVAGTDHSVPTMEKVIAIMA